MVMQYHLTIKAKAMSCGRFRRHSYRLASYLGVQAGLIS